MFTSVPTAARRMALWNALAALAALGLGLSLLASCGGGEGGTGPQENRAPVIDRSRPIVLSNFTVLKPQDSVPFDLRALDPDVQALTYRWSLAPDAQTGSFSDETVRDPVWTVGNFRGEVTVTCVVSDGELTDTWVRPFTVGAEIPGQVIDDAVLWTRAGGPYVITGELTVLSSGALTVEPGTRLHSRPRQTIVGGATSFTLHTIQVAGTVTFGAEGAEKVLLTGGLLSSVRPDQHRGLSFLGSGTGTFHGMQIEQARTAINHASNQTITIASQSLLTRNTENGVLMVAAPGGRLVIRDSQINSGAIGLALNSGATELERVRLDGNGTAVSAAAALIASDCQFSGSSATHLSIRLLDTSPAILSLQVARSNFLTVAANGPAVSIAEGTCARLDLQVRGNYWGSNMTPDAIIGRFAGREVCNAGVAGWNDSDCTDGSCDWSNEAFP